MMARIYLHKFADVILRITKIWLYIIILDQVMNEWIIYRSVASNLCNL